MAKTDFFIGEALLGEGNDLESVPLKGCPHHCGVELVCLASQGGDSYGLGHGCSVPQEPKWTNSRFPRIPMASPTMIKTPMTPRIWFP